MQTCGHCASSILLPLRWTSCSLPSTIRPMTRSSSPLWIFVKLVLVVAIVLFLAWIALLTYGKVAFAEALSLRTTITRNPGLADGLVPQGLTWHQPGKVFLTAGYMADGSPSRIYWIDPATEESGFYPLTSGGQPFYGHTGGLQFAGGFLYLADDGSGLYRFSGQLPASGSSMEIGQPIQLHCNASFVHASGGYIYVGEFNNDREYACTNNFSYNNTYHSAIIAKYRPGSFGNPVAVYSIPNEIQGMVILTDGTLVLSQSYGLSPSRFHLYPPAGQLKTGRTMHGTEVIFLGEPERTVEAPPMSEDLDLYQGQLVYLTEAASKKYRFGNLYLDRKIYSLRFD